MSKLIAVEGATLSSDPPATLVIHSEIEVPPSVLSTCIKCDGKRVYHDLAFTATIGDQKGVGTFGGSSERAKSLSKAFVREGDTVNIKVVGNSGSTDVQVKIETAGQNKVKAD